MNIFYIKNEGCRYTRANTVYCLIVLEKHQVFEDLKAQILKHFYALLLQSIKFWVFFFVVNMLLRMHPNILFKI